MHIVAVLYFYYQLIQQGSTTPEIIKDYANAESIAHGIDPQLVDTVIKGESNYDPTKIHYNDGKIGCDSVGLVQIRNCDHDVSLEQAEDPIFAVNFLLENIDKCHTWWQNTCKLNTGDISP